MRPLSSSLASVVCAFALAFPVGLFGQEQQSGINGRQQVEVNQTEVSAHAGTDSEALKAAAELPDSPGAASAKLQQQAAGQQSPSQTPSGQAASDSSQPQAQQKTPRPVGTAAAEAPKVSGVTAAQPSGVAIAPAKQRRVRTIVIKVGAIVGAGAALGTVIALTRATSSKPPGAH